MKVPFSYLDRQFADLDPYMEDIKAFVRTGDFTLGKALTEFEGRFATLMDAPFAVGVGSGTDAIAMPLKILGVGPGDEVITTPNTFIATAGAIVMTGATPVFVDSENGYVIDPAKIEAAITPRTRGIVPVHLYGLCADMKAISGIARKRGLFVVEDNAQAIDAHGPDWKQGQLSDAVCTSFIIQKNLGTFGDGGAVVTDREDIDAVVRRLRNHGSTARSVHSMGYNSRLDDLHATGGVRWSLDVDPAGF